MPKLKERGKKSGNLITRSISFYKEDIFYIDTLASEAHTTRSDAIRQIIDFWRDSTGSKVEKEDK